MSYWGRWGNYYIGRTATVREIEFDVLYALLHEFLSNISFLALYLAIVFLGIQSHNHRYAHLFKDGDVVVRREGEVLGAVGSVDRRAKGHKFSGDDPVEVAVLNALVMLVVGEVELCEVVPAQVDRPLYGFEAMQYLCVVVWRNTVHL